MDTALSSQVLVVVPAYNAESFIETTIRSVIDQSHSLWTLVVVDDGSTDRTAEIAAAFSQQDSRVQVLRLPKNSGRPSVPRNRGLEHAIASGISFDYLAFLDSDDSWLPDKLRIDLDHFRDSPSVEMVHANGILILRNGTITRKKLRRIRTVTGLLLFNHITCSSVILRKSLALERRPLFDEDPFLKAVEDTELWYRLLADKVSCGVVESYQTLYRMSETSISRTDRQRIPRFLYLHGKAAMKNGNVPWLLFYLAASARMAKWTVIALVSRAAGRGAR